MPKPERQQNVLDLLKGLRGIEPLKQLFWSELNYQLVNEPLSRRGWTDSAAQALADDPVLFAGGGENNDFHVIYGRLASDRLLLGAERPVVARLVKEHPYALFVFSNKAQDRWHFLNVKYDKAVERRQLFRRITVTPGDGLRTAGERIALLNLEEIGADRSPLTIQEQHDAAFDVEKVTKDFYAEIANWYFWACEHVTFPMPKGTPNAEAYKAQSLIRLITRLIFCWFVKEKGLIPGELFDSRALAKLLKDFDGGADIPVCADERAEEKRQTGMSVPHSTYYKAILQNLFFATLNQEMGKREFRKRNAQGRDPHRGITNLYRYQDAFSDPKAFLRLAEGIPFLNGGLFECLDKVYRAEENLPDVRIDGFSDHPKNPLSVPDFLFFGDECAVDLSAAYGEKRYRQATVRGLIHTFGRYKFTITENTPLDQEVALDPELSGKVFENLLAAYNPETATTARKQTGSFYTPREIVDYMVDEALLAYLQTKLNHGDTETQRRLRHLFAYNDEPHQFSPAEVKTLIAAIDNLKALDPACGSGAFPMGLLHKLVFILGKLDPHNEQWKRKQIAKASEIPDATVREKTLADIEQAFAANELDYGRKLYLIENCIYGVDIQPIAVQIAKMRFFISLIVDQRVDDAKSNRGILSLPNLETKFVAANTLIGIEKPAQQMLRNPQIDAKEAELRRVRERHFTARTPATKARCREQDAKLRAEISELLRADGFARETTEKLAHWNPYDQNASADFFDPEWMFGLREGFDIVIGNPPYVDSETMTKNQPTLREMYAGMFRTARGNWDLFVIFTEKALALLRKTGVMSYIVPNKLIGSPYAETIRRLLSENVIREIRDYSGVTVFAETAVYPVTLVVQKSNEASAVRMTLMKSFDEWECTNLVQPQTFRRETAWARYFERGDSAGILTKCAVHSPLREHFSRITGAATVAEAYEIKKCIAELTGRERGSYRKFLNTGTIDRYCILWGRKPTRYIKDSYDKPIVPDSDIDRINPKRLEQAQSPKIVIGGMTLELECAYDDGEFLAGKSTTIILPGKQLDLKYALGILNSRLITYWYKTSFKALSLAGGYLRINSNEIGSIPIAVTARAEHDALVKLVERILAAKRAEQPSRGATACQAAAAEVSAWEREIDERVYRLYGLTAAEIKVVESASAKATADKGEK
jgi:hypothetical protein